MTRQAKAPAVVAAAALGAFLASPEGSRAQILPDFDTGNPRQRAMMLMQESYRRDMERKRNVDGYFVRSRTLLPVASVPGAPESAGALYGMEKVSCQNAETGRIFSTFRMVSPGELAAGSSPMFTGVSAQQMREAAGGLLVASTEIDDLMAAEGVPVGLFSALDGPMRRDFGMNVLNPGDVLGTYSMFLTVGADAIDEAQAAPAAACRAADLEAGLRDNVEHIGEAVVAGRPAQGVRASALGMTQAAGDGIRTTIDTAELWFDNETLVPVMTRLEGVATQDGESKPIRIERENLDYRTVPGSEMYESYRQIMRLGGWMELGPEAEEAQRQMAELEQQLASLPEGQRAMMERMMGGQLDTMRQMAAGGDIEFEFVIDEIVVNPGTGAAAEPVVDEVLPYYVDENGVGVLRYSSPDGAADEFYLDIVRLGAGAGSAQTLASGMGPYTGPAIGVYFGSLSQLGGPFDQIELELYRLEPRRTAARFRPQVDAGRAEGMTDCGTVSGTGACSD